MLGVLTRQFLGSANDRFLRKMQPMVDAINAEEDALTKLSDEELRDLVAFLASLR